MRLYGTGSLFLHVSKRHPKGEWWLRYYVVGRQRKENAHVCLCHHTRSESKAQLLLSQRVGAAQTGTLASPKSKRALVSDLGALMFKAKRLEILRKIPEGLPAPTKAWREQRAELVVSGAEQRWNKHVAPAFGDRRAALVDKTDLENYLAERLKAGARFATVNRELQLLRRAFKLGYEHQPRLVQNVPSFPTRLPETPRKGFVEDDAFNRLHAAITEPGLAALCLTAFRLGFRKSELQNLLVVQLDGPWLRLFAGATKNGKARAVALPGDVQFALVQCAGRKEPDAHLFTWENGDRIIDFRSAWAKATKAAGLPGLLFHDLRRSAVRRMRQRGVPVPVAMRITGHLTRTVFDSYDAAHDNDVADAAKVL
jgi:integrase